MRWQPLDRAHSATSKSGLVLRRAANGCAMVIALALLAWFALPARAAADEPILTRDQLTGDWFGLRTTLDNVGISLNATEYAVPTAIIVGGEKQGITYSGQLAPSLNLDFGKMIGIHGLSAVVSAGIPQGAYGPSGTYIGNLNDVTFTEGPLGAYLDDAFLTQKLFEGALVVQLGQFGIDEFFDQNTIGGEFLNSDFSYREIDGADMPSGGPAFPMDSPGARIRISPVKGFSLQAGLFSGLPTPLTSIPSFSAIFDNGALVVGEADLSYTVGSLGSGEALVGAVYDTRSFSNLATGASLTGDEIIYGYLNQTVWQGKDDRSLALFLRGAWAPPDRNLISIDGQAGLTWNGPFAARPDDVLGLAFGYDGISSGQQDLVRALTAAGGPPQPIPVYEMVAELAYQLQVTPWFALTPDLQYIAHPGGSTAIPDAFVALLQAAVTL